MAARVAAILEDRDVHRRWPFTLGTEYSSGEFDFSIWPSLMRRDLLKATIRGRINDDGAGSHLVVLVDPGPGIYMETMLLVVCAVVGAGGVAIIFQDFGSTRKLDWSPLWMFAPLALMFAIGVLLRTWFSWRASRFVTAVAHQIEQSPPAQT